METKIRMTVALIALVAVLITGCRFIGPESPGDEAQAGLANPSALYCQEQGGVYQIVTGADDSQDGLCRFDDGSECDGWAFHNGECAPESSQATPASAQAEATPTVPVSTEAMEIGGTETEPATTEETGDGTGGPAGMANPASVYCEEHGGRLEIRSDDDGNEFGVCVLEDGSECDEWAYFLSECGPGANIDYSVQGSRLIYGWYGVVVGPDEGESGAYMLNLLPETAGTLELVAMSEDMEALLEASSDADTPLHVWGVLTCDPNNHCLIEATQVLPDGVQEAPPPDPVDGWEGTLEALPPMAQFDEMFVLNDPNFPVTYGISAPRSDVAAALDNLRDTDRVFRVFGELTCNVIAVNGCQIRADRIEVVP
jgi:putative hemolysin